MDIAGWIGGMDGQPQPRTRWLWGGVSPRRPERLVAVARVCIAATFLLAELAGPAGLGRACALLAAYLGWALLLAAVDWHAPALGARLGLAAHAVDLAVFGAITWAGGGIASAFFGHLVFIVLAATVRWGGRATLWTGVAALAVFVAAGRIAAEPPLLAPDALLLRVLYVIMLASVFALVAVNERTVRTDLLRLASWTPVVESPSPILAILEYLAKAVGVPRVIMVWEEEDEPSQHVAAWSQGRFELAHEPSGTIAPLVPAPLTEVDFLCSDVGAAPAAAHWLGSGGRPWTGDSVHPTLRERFAMVSVVSPRLRGPTVSGRVFCLDKPGPTHRDLAVSRIAARQTVAHLELFLARERLRHTAAVQERVRLARDVHDGVLQSLTEMALLAQMAERHVGSGPVAARAGLQELGGLLAATQRQVREFVEQFRSDDRAASDRNGDLADRLLELASRLRRHWGLHVEMDVDRPGSPMPAYLAREAYLVIHEALINVARHARATSVRVEVRFNDSCMIIVVADNGQGFDFCGRYDARQLADAGLGPRTLRERVVAIGGRLTLESSPGGSRLEIDLPMVAD